MAYDRGGRSVQPSEETEQTVEVNRPVGRDPRKARSAGAPPITGAKGIDGAAGRKKTAPSETRHGSSALSRLRVLPVVIFVAVLLLSFKITSLWDAVRNPRALVSITTLAEAEPKPSAALGRVAASGTPVTQLAQASNADKANEEPLDPVLFTRSEIELLQELSKRRKELDARERTVIQREGLLTAAETRIEKKIAELQGVKTDIEALIEKYDEQEEEQFKGLVSIYEKMKPKDAARIFDELGIEILLEVFDRMKASKSAPIMAKMRPARAKEITARIAERREMPKMN